MALRTHRLMTQLTSAAVLGFGLLGATTASATVTEPSGLQVPIPQAQSLDYYDTTRYNVNTLGIQTLLDSWEGVGVVDAYKDASATNVVFSPLCGLDGQMILRGGACMVDFGWYCTSDAPGAETIHPLITIADIIKYHDVTLATLPGKPPGLNSWADLKNNDKGFCPTVQSGILQPLTGTASLSAVRDTPEFKACASGQIGFAFKGNPTSICPMSKFSEPSRNQMSTLGSPWINAVVYQSQKYPGTFYVAFEDMPTTPASFTPKLSEVAATYTQMRVVSSATSTDWKAWSNDGDFNDFVFKVSGIQCAGGGQPCVPTDSAGQPLLGACSIGVTACSSTAGVAGACMQKIQPTPETCDGWDNNCNGVADDGDKLCQPGYVCSGGKCVGSCGSAEFPCTDPGTVCETTGPLTNYCVEKACKGITCPTGQRCTGGACVGGCEGVTCPTNQECIAGVCIDLCAGITCPSSFVCERGTCVPSCACLPCTDPTKSYCNTDGHCIDQACANVTCPAKQTCQAGTCVDPCASNPCNGAVCTTLDNGTYTCGVTTTPGGTSPGGGLTTTGGTGGGIGLGTSTGPLGTPGNGTSNNAFVSDGSQSGCGCHVTGSATGQRGVLLLGLLGLATTVLRRGRKSLQS